MHYQNNSRSTGILGHLCNFVFIALLIGIIIGGQFFPISGFALTVEQRNAFDSGIYFFDANTSSNLCVDDSVGLLGNDNIEKIYNFFLNKNLTKEQAAGITGNAIVESGGDPEAVSKSGYRGIFQWDKDNRWPRVEQFAQENNQDPASLQLQLDFAYQESLSRGQFDGIQAYNDIDHTTWYWGRYFEVAIINGNTNQDPLTNVQALQRRMDEARNVFYSYGGLTGSTAPLSSQNCIGGNGQNTRFIDNFVVYDQYDPSWKDLPYDSSTIGDSGCGPAAMAMIISTITERQVTPVETANYAAEQNLYISGVGSSWSIGPVLASRWGLKSHSVDREISAITTALREGKLIIAPGQGPKPFTSWGHFIVIRGLTSEGKFMIGDSAHKDTNTTEWDPEFILSNMRTGGIYAIYK